MTIIYVKTHLLENEGAEADDGSYFNGNANWKFSNTNDYILSAEDLTIADLLAYMHARLESMGQTLAYKEIIAHFEEVDYGFQTDLELFFGGSNMVPYERRVMRIDVESDMNYRLHSNWEFGF